MQINILNSAVAALFLFSAVTSTDAQLPLAPKPAIIDWTLADYEVQGKVKEIAIFQTDRPYDMDYAQFNEKGNLTRLYTSSTIAPQISAMRTIGDIVLEYDKQGRILSKTYSQRYLTNYSKITFEYKDKEALVTYYKTEDPKVIAYRVKHYYEEGDNKLSKICLYRDDKLSRISSFDAYDYDKDGNLIAISDYKCINGGNCDGSGGEYFTYTDGRLTSIKKDWAGMDFGSTQYKYNDKNQLISVEQVSKDKKTTLQQSFEYNAKGQVIKKVDYTNHQVTTDTYEYDEQGNWITRNRIQGEKVQQVTRKITYF